MVFRNVIINFAGHSKSTDMNNKFSIFLAFIAFTLISCGGKNSAPSVASGEWSGFQVEKISGSENEFLSRDDDNGFPAEGGYVLNGVKDGVWITYHSARNANVRGESRIKTLDTYQNGDLEGVSLEFDQRGQIIKKAYYRNGDLDGPQVSYKFGRPLEIIPYRNGIINGKVMKYYPGGKVREEIEYKDGVQHGTYNHYNEDQKLDMQYEYKNGEKVSGGIVEVEEDEE